MMRGIVDLHLHSAPSLLPRRYSDSEMVRVARQAGVSTIVLKAHEGSTAARAQLVGQGVVGGIVLNSFVGGANPDAVRVAAGLGVRVVWMPTASAHAHIAAYSRAELSVHRQGLFSAVPVCHEGHLRSEWYQVFEEVVAHDLVLASGHISMDEAVCAFQAAAACGVSRFLINHPLMPFLGWRDEHGKAFRRLEARIEVGVVADHLAGSGPRPTETLVACYPHRLLVFGSDLGHTSFPEYLVGIESWMERVEPLVDDGSLEAIMKANGKQLLGG
jgi:hypothetical protein